MSGKSFFIDLTKCTSCRGCQVACKQWHGLPAEQTINHGSHQNPMDLSFNTYKLVRFTEDESQGKLNWLFFPDQCRHCLEPPCLLVAENPEAIIQDENAAVLYTPLTAQEDFETIRSACPYDIPRKQEDGTLIAKCDMCHDRVKDGLLPACVQTCPTGTMNFGDREDMLSLANKTLAEVKKKWPNAMLVNADDVRVIYLVAYDPKAYYQFLTAEAAPVKTFSRRDIFAGLRRSARSNMG